MVTSFIANSQFLTQSLKSLHQGNEYYSRSSEKNSGIVHPEKQYSYKFLFINNSIVLNRKRCKKPQFCNSESVQYDIFLCFSTCF